jgi:glycosyltransferase involved in cell wall biosynthesis
MLPRAIRSVLDQTYRNIQVVVVDDNNPDTEWRETTSKKMKEYADDSRVKYVCHPKNMNGSVARNTGIREADGQIVCFLDDDDWFLPTKIELQVEYLVSHPEHRAVYCGWNRDGKIFNEGKEGNLSFELLSGVQLVYTNVIMMWREDALNCGGWDETFRRHQEAAFMLRYFRYGGTVGYVPKVLVEFDISDRSNAASDSIINEQQMDHYLNSYKDIIEDCEKQRKGAKKDIYSYRYRGVWLHHLKYKKISKALSVYFRMVVRMPIKFNMDILRYTLKRIKK